MKIKIEYPVEEKYIPVAYYLGLAVDGVAKIREIKEVNNQWEIEIYDKEGARLGEFSCPLEWIIDVYPVVLSSAEYLNSLIGADEQDFDEKIMDVFQVGDKNGQLKQFLKDKEVIENVKLWLKAIKNEGLSHMTSESHLFFISRVEKSLKNIKQ